MYWNVGDGGLKTGEIDSGRGARIAGDLVTQDRHFSGPILTVGMPMRFWIKCTRFGTGDSYHVNISLVGGMRREENKTILEFVGGNAQTIDVNETPEQILAIHLGGAAGD